MRILLTGGELMFVLFTEKTSEVIDYKYLIPVRISNENLHSRSVLYAKFIIRSRYYSSFCKSLAIKKGRSACRRRNPT